MSLNANEVRNAIIEDAWIGDDDHGGLSSYVVLDYGGSHQGFGGYRLFCPGHAGDYGGLWVWRVLRIAGVERWADLPGKTVRARIDDGLVQAIGHIVKDEWFEPRKEFK